MENSLKSHDITDRDYSPDDSGCPFRNALNIEESTPISIVTSRKRKACYGENFPSPLHRPQFSSTLNESLMENLKKIHLQNEGWSRFPSNSKFLYSLNVIFNRHF